MGSGGHTGIRQRVAIPFKPLVSPADVWLHQPYCSTTPGFRLGWSPGEGETGSWSLPNLPSQIPDLSGGGRAGPDPPAEVGTKKTRLSSILGHWQQPSPPTRTRLQILLQKDLRIELPAPVFLRPGSPGPESLPCQTPSPGPQPPSPSDPGKSPGPPPLLPRTEPSRPLAPPSDPVVWVPGPFCFRPRSQSAELLLCPASGAQEVPVPPPSRSPVQPLSAPSLTPRVPVPRSSAGPGAGGGDSRLKGSRILYRAGRAAVLGPLPLGRNQ